jgi:hypothetical protein
MKLQAKLTLKALIYDALKVKKTLSREEIKQLARDNGYEENTAERRLRAGDIWSIPHIKLNYSKKPCRKGEHVSYYKWDGSDTIFKK